MSKIQNIEAVLSNSWSNHLKQLGITFLDFFPFSFYCIQNILETLITEISDGLHVWHLLLRAITIPLAIPVTCAHLDTIFFLLKYVSYDLLEQ